MTQAYADTSFIVRLLLMDEQSDDVVAKHRSLGQPRLYLNALHELEVPNAFRLRTFGATRSGVRARPAAFREEESAFRKLQVAKARGRFRSQHVDWDEAFAAVPELSERHTARLGARSFDLMHVQLALLSPSRDFLTCDIRQAALAKAVGLTVTFV